MIIQPGRDVLISDKPSLLIGKKENQNYPFLLRRDMLYKSGEKELGQGRFKFTNSNRSA